jgi:hypothetical protein
MDVVDRCAAPMQARLKVQTHQALFDEDLVSSYFPHGNVLHISGSATYHGYMWGYLESSRLYREAVAAGEQARRLHSGSLREGIIC